MKNKKSLSLSLIYSLSIFLSASFFTACQGEAPQPFEDKASGMLQQGELEFEEGEPHYKLEIWDSKGKLVLSRKGEALHGIFYHGDKIGFNLFDPLFNTGVNVDTFSSLNIVIPVTDWPARVIFGENTQASADIKEQFYMLPKDWDYVHQSGYLEVEKAYDDNFKGRFSFCMKVGEIGGAHPAWGSKVTVKGSFISKGWEHLTTAD